MKKRLANFLLATAIAGAPLAASAGDGTNSSFSGCSGCSNSPAYNPIGGTPSASKSTGGYVLGYVKTSLDARDGNAPSPGLGQG